MNIKQKYFLRLLLVGHETTYKIVFYKIKILIFDLNHTYVNVDGSNYTEYKLLKLDKFLNQSIKDN